MGSEDYNGFMDGREGCSDDSDMIPDYYGA